MSVLYRIGWQNDQSKKLNCKIKDNFFWLITQNSSLQVNSVIRINVSTVFN